MDQNNPILEDYKLLLVFRNIGQQLLQQVRAAMTGQPYNNLFKTTAISDQNELFFTYLEHNFKIQIELFFSHSKMPKLAFLATYYLPKESKLPTEEIISYPFDLDYNVNDIYKLDDFAAFYLVEFHQNVKKTFSDNHISFPIKLAGK